MSQDVQNPPRAELPASDLAATNVRPEMRWRVTIRDLVLWVLTAGVTAGVLRSVRDVGVAQTNHEWERLVGAVVSAVAIVLLLPVLHQFLALTFGRGEGPRKPGRVSRFWMIGWRIAVFATLTTMVSAEVALLRLPTTRLTAIGQAQPGMGWIFDSRQGLLPICLACFLVGLVAGMAPGPIGPRPSSGRLRVLLAPLLVVLGLLVVTSQSYLPYLVLIAVECVSNSEPLADYHGPFLTLSDRFARAGWDSLVAALIATVATAFLIRDLRKPRPEPVQALKWGRPGWMIRLSILLIGALAALWLVLVTIPRLHPNFAQGFWMVLEPVDRLAIVAGFATLGVGLAARALTPARPSPARAGGWRGWLRGLGWIGLQLAPLFLIVLGILPFLSTMAITEDPTFSGAGFEGDTTGVYAALLDTVSRFDDWLTRRHPWTLDAIPFLAPDRLPWLLALPWLTVFTILVVVENPSAGECPLDRLAESPGGASRFAWLASTFLTACLLVLPLLLVGGMVLLHLRLNAHELLGINL